jgi:riboflavin kinase/FMN adenylyltransferase
VRVIHGIDSLGPLKQSVLTVGNFDGVHRAHQQLLTQANLFAARTGGPVVVLTFEPHPLNIVAPHKAPARLSLPQEKLRLLAEAGADITVVAASEPGLLGMEADKFIEDVLIARFHPTHIVEGPSFGFGRGRKGTPQMLADVARRFHCEVHIVGPVRLQIEQGETVMVSSSLIRDLLRQGRVREAALCLGRPYALIGEVIHGDGRGKTLGFPTANLQVKDQLIPAEGVYAGHATMEGEPTRLAAISIGRTPTFGETELRVEAYLLDYDGDLYARSLRLTFDRWLRSQQKYSSPAALVEQVQKDIAAVRAGPMGA